MDISAYVTNKKREMTLMKKFNRLIKGQKKTKIRELELRLLRPKPIEKYHGPTSGRKDFSKRSIRLTFDKSEWILRWMKLFRVNSYVEYNTWDIDFIRELIVKMEHGRLEWDKKKKCYYLISRNGKNKIRI